MPSPSSVNTAYHSPVVLSLAVPKEPVASTSPPLAAGRRSAGMLPSASTSGQSRNWSVPSAVFVPLPSWTVACVVRLPDAPATAPRPMATASMPSADAALPTATAPESLAPVPVPEPAVAFHPMAIPLDAGLAPLPSPIEYASFHAAKLGSFSESATSRSSVAALRRPSASMMFLNDAK